MDGNSVSSLPVPNDVQRVKRARSRRRGTRRRTIVPYVVCLAVAVTVLAELAVLLWVPILRISGQSMAPTLQQGDIVLAIKIAESSPGEIVAFQKENKILVKRVIAQSGDLVDLDEQGGVYVNGDRLDENYLQQPGNGITDIALPYTVPDGTVFVMGDNRIESVDSRSTAVGCVTAQQITGKVVFRIWPLSRIGLMK